MNEKHPIFKSYQEYVALCLESGEDVPTLSEFTGSAEPFKVKEEETDDIPTTA